MEVQIKYLTSSFVKVYILKYCTTGKTIKSELFAPFQLSEKMLQKSRAGVVGRGPGFTLALMGFLSD